jgi:hypothetical protein
MDFHSTPPYSSAPHSMHDTATSCQGSGTNEALLKLVAFVSDSRKFPTKTTPPRETLRMWWSAFAGKLADARVSHNYCLETTCQLRRRGERSRLVNVDGRTASFGSLTRKKNRMVLKMPCVLQGATSLIQMQKSRQSCDLAITWIMSNVGMPETILHRTWKP